MNEEQIKQLKTIIEEEERDCDFNDYVFNYVDEDTLKDIEDFDELRDYLNDDLNDNREITTAEVIYYSNAIDYLKENDPSLNESLELARELGYSLENVNSELLASLLKTQENEEDFYQFLQNVLERAEELFSEVLK